MSVGRALCKRLIDVAEDLRDYAALVDQFEGTADVQMIVGEAVACAPAAERLIPRLLVFEGEDLRQLESGQLEAAIRAMNG